MLELKVTPGFFIGPDGTMMSFDAFKILTGKTFDCYPRQGKLIIIDRNRGHTRVYDTAFVVGSKYKRKRATYTCVHISKEGNALLTPSNGNLKAITATEPTEWELIE